MKEKWGVFDFCETLVNFQTADAYVNFVCKHIKTRRMLVIDIIHRFLIYLQIITVLSKLFPKYSINKKIVLSKLKGVDSITAERLAKEFYKTIIIPNLIPRMIYEYNQCKKKGYKILIVSGGYDIYIKYFCKDFGADYFLSTKLEYNNGHLTGRIYGKDCLRNNKIVILQNSVLYNAIRNNYTIGYSDSKSDIPILSWCSECYVVSKNKEQKWAYVYNFKQIIWQEEKKQ